MHPMTPFSVHVVDFAERMHDLHAVRERVFVREQKVPVELERDELDPRCLHVLAVDEQGRPIGTGRLTPEWQVGRMAVLDAWRGVTV